MAKVKSTRDCVTEEWFSVITINDKRLNFTNELNRREGDNLGFYANLHTIKKFTQVFIQLETFLAGYSNIRFSFNGRVRADRPTTEAEKQQYDKNAIKRQKKAEQLAKQKAVAKALKDAKKQKLEEAARKRRLKTFNTLLKEFGNERKAGA